MTRAELESEIASLESRLDDLRDQLEELPPEPVKYQRPPRKGTMERLARDTATNYAKYKLAEMVKSQEYTRRMLDTFKDRKAKR